MDSTVPWESTTPKLANVVLESLDVEAFLVVGTGARAGELDRRVVESRTGDHVGPDASDGGIEDRSKVSQFQAVPPAELNACRLTSAAGNRIYEIN